jgi:hypothetical protein
MFQLKDNFKYLVVDTGYTSRLIDKVGEIEEQIKSQFDHLCDNTDDDEEVKTVENSCEHCKDKVVYIRDCVLRKGKSRVATSIYNNDCATYSYVEDVLKSRDNSDLTSCYSGSGGYIVIRCDSINMAFTIIQILMDQKHCGCFRIDSLTDMILVKDVLIINFDCESG